jgi:hypothetical protein
MCTVEVNNHITNICSIQIVQYLLTHEHHSLFQPKLKWKWGEHTSRKTLSQKHAKDTFGAAPPTLTYKSKKSVDILNVLQVRRIALQTYHGWDLCWQWQRRSCSLPLCICMQSTAVFLAFRMPTDFSCAPALPKHRQTQIEPAQQTPEVPADSELTWCGSLHEQVDHLSILQENMTLPLADLCRSHFHAHAESWEQYTVSQRQHI